MAMEDKTYCTEPMQPGERILCRHPFSESKRAYVVPTRVEPLYKCYWNGLRGKLDSPTLQNLVFNFHEILDIHGSLTICCAIIT